MRNEILKIYTLGEFDLTQGCDKTTFTRIEEMSELAFSALLDFVMNQFHGNNPMNCRSRTLFRVVEWLCSHPGYEVKFMNFARRNVLPPVNARNTGHNRSFWINLEKSIIPIKGKTSRESLYKMEERFKLQKELEERKRKFPSDREREIQIGTMRPLEDFNGPRGVKHRKIGHS